MSASKEVFTSKELFDCPEFQALLQSLGVPKKGLVGLTIRIRANEPARIRAEYLGRIEETTSPTGAAKAAE